METFTDDELQYCMNCHNVSFDWVEDDKFRFMQAETLAEYLDTLTLPYLLIGDFNDPPNSRT